MNRTLVVLAIALASPSVASAAPAPGLHHIVPHGRPVHAGDHVRIQVRPAAPEGVSQVVAVVTADGRTTSLVGPYRAPYVIAPGAPPVEIVAALEGEGWRRETRSTLELAPGQVIGADDCLGVGQFFVKEYGDIGGSAGDLSDLPVAQFEARASLPGFSGTVPVQVLVCRSGAVLDAYVAPTLRDVRGASVERDPRIVAAAEAAARRVLFRRGGAAAWVTVPVRF